ncbi:MULTISPECIES: glycoside hydrolase [unclassified Arcicella]|uniref:glycoside hydrolase n=1 Tax=unclassified Arcicella TaxID=2644986 RepID=UPI0028585C2E|nr:MULTISPECIES: glycoside hydrolase [unclassified Arcicella]MDR6562304.1 hypothetical protein [Arcicella sp. BE51]MDR6812001.1 hypothetical protein [Arcicella sp. BE140]MDR6823312.1 hypothetical protein [Arcicella sp. BE139]
MKKIILFLITLVVLPAVAYCKVWKMTNPSLEVQFNDKTSLLTVIDKRCQKVWQQTALKDQFTVVKTTQKDNSIFVTLSGKYPLELVFTLDETASLTIDIKASEKMLFEDLSFPSAFQTPNSNHYLLYTDGEGFLLPVTDTEYPLGRNKMYSMSGLSMPWMGITDNLFETGYMAILNTPDDGEINVKKENGLITFEPVWLSSKNTFGYNRKVTYHFFDKGGYVAQCKKYRENVWANNSAKITLKEKQKEFPAIEKMMGGVHLYLWDNGREVSFAQELKQAGIEKAFVLWNPNHPPYPEIGYDNKLKELGYLSGVYELFRDAKLRDTIGTINTTSTTGTFLNRFSFPGLFNQITLKQKDGKLHYSGFGYDINPKAILPYIPSLRTDRELSIYPHESFFSDGFLASGIFECYSKDNPLTRSQYKQAVIDIHHLFINKYKMIMGMEWGADYGVPTTAYAHGMTTLHRMLYRSPDRKKKKTIYYYGDWSHPSRPSIMVGEYVADKNYLKWAINEKIRVPLYQLVYHDAIVTTWRWDDANHHMPEIWWKKDLFNILYGTAPIWCLDRPRWDKFKRTFVESYKNIAPWLQKIGYDEMVSHRFVSSDYQVQETVFASGKKAIVNFGDTESIYDGKIIKAKGFITLE